jgi:hypothetical protein
MASWLSKLGSTKRPLARVGGENNHPIRSVGEGAVVGAGLGLIQSRLGTLDYKKNATSPAIPIDLGIAIASIAGSLLLGNSKFAPEFRNVGSAGATIFAFRKAEQLATAARLRPNPVALTGAQTAQMMGGKTAVHGDEMGADPILSAAAALL